MSTDTATALLADALAGVPGYAELEQLERAATRAQDAENLLGVAYEVRYHLEEARALIEQHLTSSDDDTGALLAVVSAGYDLAERVRLARKRDHLAALAVQHRAGRRLEQLGRMSDEHPRADGLPPARPCTATRLDGARCEAYALPWCERPLCRAHATAEERAHNAEQRAMWQAAQDARKAGR